MLRKPLRKNTSPFEKKVASVFNSLKKEIKTSSSPIIAIYDGNSFIGFLRPISESSLYDSNEVELLARWRKTHEEWFPAQFKVTIEGTRKWLKESLLDTKGRFLFMIESPSGKPIGHMGLFRFDFTNYACEIDNVIRGERDCPGIMTHALDALIAWTRKTLGVKDFYLEVFSDNKKAINLYSRRGFKEIKRVPLQKVIEKDRVSWVESKGLSPSNIKRYNSYMKLQK